MLEVVSDRAFNPPKNHQLLLDHMIGHAMASPRIEVGGIFLTDQEQKLQKMESFIGEKNKVDIPPLEHSKLRQQIGWDTYVVYHSHPVSALANFSSRDLRYFQIKIAGHLLYHFRKPEVQMNLDFERYFGYFYVVTADGRKDWVGIKYEFTQGQTSEA